jgi:PAS domain S-box-containing protein
MKKNIQLKPQASVYADAEDAYQKNNFVGTLDTLDYLDQSLTKEPDPTLEMKSTNLRGLIAFKQGNFNTAEEYFLKSLSISKLLGDPRYIYNRYDNLATLYINTKRFQYGIDYLQKAIELKEAAGNQKDLTRGYIQLAGLQIGIENIEASKEALKKAYLLIRKYKLRELLMHWHMVMGMQSKREGNFKNALSEYTKAIRFGTEFNDPSVTAKAHANQGDILMHLGRWPESEKKYLASLQIAKDHSMLTIELSSSVQLAAISLEKGDVAWSRTLFEYVTRKAAALENDALHKDLAELSARLNKTEGNYKEALEAHEKYVEYYKRGYDSELSRTVLDIQARYEHEKKEKELQKIKLSQIESELKTLRAERALQTSEMRFRALIENGTDIIYLIDQNLHPTYASPAAFHALGYEENQPWTQDVRQLLHPADLAIVLDKINQVIQNPGVPIFGQIRLPKKDGGFIWVEGTATNLFHVEGANGIVCNLRDITERKQAEAEIKELNESLERKIAERTFELKEANMGLESFSYSVSHDLRTPLRVISGYSGLLHKKYGETMTEEAREFLKAIRENASHMGHLIDDLLNLSRLGRQDLVKTIVDMNKIVDEAIAELRKEDSSLPLPNINVQELSGTRADSGLIKQVWLNIISNAIKYSRKKAQPTIEIGSIVEDRGTTYYIKDNGAGFDMAHADKLFGAFQRLHDKNEFEGTGVGLAIVHQIINKHGGRIWAEGVVNEGATFYFTLGH